MRRLALAPILVCALLSPSTALALGVGDIELQSALNQPLDAEIPLRGVSSEESGDVVVTLASEEAFREVGLERPFSLTRLQFEVVSRNGSHYIQVSSHKPITEPFLSFLIEVDSPQGNLLREYTVLLDPPVFASEEGTSATDDGSAQRQARDEADEPSGASGDMADGGDMSGRLADTDTAGRSASSSDTEAPSTGAAQQRQGQFGDTPMFLRIAREEEAAERKLAEQAAQRKREREAAAAARERARAESAPAPSRSAMSGAAASGTDSGQAASAEQSRQQEYGPVQEGETLWGIAERLQRGEVTTQQMMLALLRYNPEAFDSNNINRLKQGYVLRVPDADEVRSISAQQAIAQVRDQNGLWREWRDSLQQGDATRVAAAQQPQDTEDTDVAVDSARGDAGESGATGGTDDSRLDIVGADEGGATSDESASATSSTASGAREQLQLAREELASVRSEKEELSERVEQLESTVDKMEQLVTVREQQLAQLERQLAELREQTGASDDTAAAAGEGAHGEQADAAADAGEAAQGEQDDMMVADAAGGSGGGDGSAAASGDSGGGDTAGDPAAGEGTTGDQASASEQSAADDDGAGTQTAASDQQREVVNPADDTQQQERGWLDAALGFLASIGATVSGAVSGLAGGSALSLPVIGGAGLAVLALVLLAVRRRRAAQAAADEELMAPVAVGEGHAETEPMGLGGDDRPATESPVATADSPSESSARAPLMDEELDLSGLDVDPEGATPGDEVEQDDTLVEADTYLAYGLHQQAEDLLRLALEEHPERLDYREKLLETLSAAGKGDEFVRAAEDFHDRLGGSSDPAWQRVSAMGRKIAPDHALFAAGAAAAAGGAAMAASGSGADDDDFAFDLGSDSPASSGDELPGGAEADPGDSAPAATASGDSGGFDDLTFDLSDLEDSTPAAEPATEASESPGTSAGADDGGLDFDLGDLGFGDDSPSTTSGKGEASTGAASAPADDGLDLDLGDLGIDDSTSTAGSDSGTASAQGEGEIDLSDFDDPELGSDSGSPATETATAATGEDDLDFDLNESTSSDSSGLDDFGLGDLGSDATDATSGIEDLETSASDSTTAAAGEEDPFGGLDDLGGGDSDAGEFDLSSFEQELGGSDAPQPAPAVAADGAASGGEADDLATMLDLAKAYIDMGDAESASNALEEVIAGGTEEQRAEARSLLETVQ